MEGIDRLEIVVRRAVDYKVWTTVNLAMLLFLYCVNA